MIYIKEDLFEEIKHEAEHSYPSECCGIIFGRIEKSGKFAVEIRRIINSFGNGEEYHRFLITPEDMLRAELYARANGMDIVGFYHSHPDCPAIASEYDRSHALPVYSYIIVSAVEGEAENVLSWELEDGSFFEEEIELL